MSIASVLRLACQASGLGITGSSATLLKRLVSSGRKKSVQNKPASKKNASTKKLKPVTMPRKMVPLKGVKGGGSRLSASYYFHNMCDGKISRCKPQVILQPDGRRRLKMIRIVTRGDLTYPQWVNVA